MRLQRCISSSGLDSHRLTSNCQRYLAVACRAGENAIHLYPAAHAGCKRIHDALDAMALQQNLRCERRPKVSILLLDKFQDELIDALI